MIQYLKPILILILAILIQLIIIPLISVYNIAPQVILIILVYYTLLGGQIFGTILGFISGFLFDLFSGGVLGSAALAMTISIFVIGYFYNENRLKENITTYFFVLYLFIAGIIYFLIYTEVGNFNPETKLNVILLEGTLFPSIYTSLFGVLVVLFNSKRNLT